MQLSDRIELEIVVDAPAEIVWRTLTSPEHIVAWYAFDGAEVDLRPGGNMAFHWNEHGTFLARIERVESPYVLAFRYASLAPDIVPQPGNATLVTLSLADGDKLTTVSLVESGYAGLYGSPEEISRHAAESELGWRNALDLLRDRAELIAQPI